MKQDIKDKEPRKRKPYVPASMKVLTIRGHGIICASDPSSTSFQFDPFYYDDGGDV